MRYGRRQAPGGLLRRKDVVMAPVLEADFKELMRLAQDFVDVSSAFEGIKNFISETHVSAMNWPVEARNAAATEYKNAASTAERAAGAVQAASNSVALNLQDVVHYYDANEYHSSVVPSSPPTTEVRANSGASWITPMNAVALSAHEGGFGGAVLLLGHLYTARNVVNTNARLVGPMGAAILMINYILVTPNIRDWGPFEEVRDTWRAIADRNLKPMREGLQALLPIKTWEGEAASACNLYLKGKLVSAIERLEALSRSMGDLCDEVASGIKEIDGAWLSLLIVTGVELIALRLFVDPVAQILLVAVLVSTYLAQVLQITKRLNNWSHEMKAKIKEIQREADDLAALCLDDAQVLENNRNRLQPKFMVGSNYWSKQEWDQNWHPKTEV
jgi:hypothetical protein